MTAQTTHPHARPERRLIDIAQLAEKLSYSKDWVFRNLPVLESIGFPKPVLDERIRAHRRWDVRAIDLWLDSQMPPALRDQGRIRIDAIDTAGVEQRLNRRAAELAL